MKHQQNYKIFFLFLCLLQLVLLQNSYAINIPRALLLNQQREQDLFLQFEKNKILRKIENEKLEKKIQKYKKSPKATNLTQHLLKIKKIDSKGTKGCFKIKKILLQESTAFSMVSPFDWTGFRKI